MKIVMETDMLELPKSCMECSIMIVDDWQEETCPGLGRLYDFPYIDISRHPKCPLIEVPDELADVFKYLTVSYEIWQRSGDKNSLRNALTDAIRFKTTDDSVSDEDNLKAMGKEYKHLKILHDLKKLKEREEEEG